MWTALTSSSEKDACFLGAASLTAIDAAEPDPAASCGKASCTCGRAANAGCLLTDPATRAAAAGKRRDLDIRLLRLCMTRLEWSNCAGTGPCSWA
eukprot:535904-Rhodomonas_salina.3